MSNTLPPGTATVRVCARCKHMRTRAKVALFDAQDLQSPGVLKAQVEWDQEMKQRAQIEMQRAQSRQPFEYEPHHYAWCASFTRVDLVRIAGDANNPQSESALQTLMADGGATINPVTGEIGALYHLCAWHNENGDCAAYESK